MAAITSYLQPLKDSAYSLWESGKTIVSSAFSSTDERIAGLVSQISLKKAEKKEEAEANKFSASNIILISGDLFTMGYLAFEGAAAIAPAMASASWFSWATMGCGIAGGIINIGVGLVSLVEAIQAFKNGDKVLGTRLLLDFICMTFIGSIMVLTSLALQVSAVGGAAALFTTNPWLLPVLFFVVSLPLIFELTYRIAKIVQSADAGSLLQINRIKEALQQENWAEIQRIFKDPRNPLNLDACYQQFQTGGSQAASKRLSDTMELLQAEVGVEAAIEIFRLLELLLKKKKEAAIAKIRNVEEKLKEWNHSLYVRMGQQILYTAAFGVSLGVLSPKMNANLVNSIQNFFMMFANVIPLYMDTFWPFRRNTPIVVPKVESLPKCS